MRIRLAALIPAFNEQAVLKNTLESILKAGMPKEDIYVINDGSRDNTAEIARSLGVNVFDNETNLGKAESVTKTLFELSLLTRYTHISFLDADTLVDREYFTVVRARLSDDLRRCEKHNKKKRIWRKERKPIGVLCGKAKSLPYNWITAFRAYEYWLTHALHKPAQAKIGVIMVAPGCASTYRVEALRNIKWSRDTRTEDMDATIQAALAHERIEYEDKAVVYTQDPRTLEGYVNQLFKRWYTGTWQVMRKHHLLWSGPFSRLHWECRLMTLEPFTYIWAIAYMVLSHREKLPWVIGTTFLTTFLLAALASWRERRLDIVKNFWIFPFILSLNLLMFLGASWNILSGQKNRSKTHKWYSPERYALSNEK